MKPIYLDYAAATPLDEDVFLAMRSFYSENFYNPSALYTGAREAKKALESARESVSQTVGCRPSEIVFTAGGTESANLAIKGVIEASPQANCVVSAVEHEAVLAPARQLSARICPVDGFGRVLTTELKKLIDDNTVLLSVMYANNEVGTVQPVTEIVALADSIRKDRRRRNIDLPLYVHTDAAQAALYLNCSVSHLGVDLMTLNGGKMYGPKQSGILYIRTGTRISPQIVGGGQEWGIRSGTENVAQAVGFSHALKKAQASYKQRGKDVGALSDYFINNLEQRFSAVRNGHPKKRLPNNVHVIFPGHDNERILFSLDDQGVWAATGSACSASSEEVSHVLSAMGVSAEDARASLRFTLGVHTTKDEIDRALFAIEIALKS